MQSRKISNNCTIEANNLLSYVRDFCVQANNYRRFKNEDSLILLNRSASLLTTALQPQYFVAGNLELTKFYIDLHAVISCLPIDSDALWTCISVLQHCARNLESCHALVHDFRFIPLLTHLLKRTQISHRQQKLLILDAMQELTYGINIKCDEPFVAVLLEQLIQIVYKAAETGEESHGHLALSILINICYKNFVVLFRFLRSVNLSCFSKCIQSYGMLANKMLIIISEDMHAPDQQELHLFLRSNFAAIGECLKKWNVSNLRHIVDFLKDSKAHTGLHQAMLTYEHYCQDIEKLLNHLECGSSMDNSNEDGCKQQQICMGLLFELIEYIVELSSVPEIDGQDNSIISLDSNLSRIYELLSNWLQSEGCGVMAVNLLNALVGLGKCESIVSRIAEDPTPIISLISTTEKNEISPFYTAAVLQLFVTLLSQSKTEKLILSKISESYFDKVLSTVLNYKPELSADSLSMAEIEKSILCLWLFISFADIAKKAYFEKCCALLRLPQIHYALARAITGGQERLCTTVLRISQFEHFPRTDVAKLITKLNSCSNQINTCQTSSEHLVKMTSIWKSQHDFVNKELEDRLQALIETITLAQQNNQLNNVNTSQMIELFDYKIQKYTAAEESMQGRLEQASEQITQLTQRISLQNAEIEKYERMNFEWHINRESLQTQRKDLTLQKDTLKRTVTDLMKKLTNHSDALLISEKKLSAKVAELIDAQKSYSSLQDRLEATLEELEKFQASAKENSLRIEKLKKTIAAYEVDIKDKVRYIEEKERELSKTQKVLEEQKEARKKSEDVISVLESQLQEKNEQIANYEAELSETEELRKTIMSLMESKKPKRKL